MACHNHPYTPPLVSSIDCNIRRSIIWGRDVPFFLRIFFSKIKLWKLALICYGMGVADELLQLYHAPWIESVRQTRIGGLALGFGFLWSDILCYAVGTLIAYLLISFIERNDTNKISPTIFILTFQRTNLVAGGFTFDFTGWLI